MHLNFLFKKDNDNISKKGKVNVPDGLFTKCPKCSKMILTDELFLDNCVCHSCGYYFKIDAKTRISMVIDKDTFEEWDTGIEEKNPCDFEGYIQKTADLKSKTGLDEAIVTGKGKIDGKDTVIGVCDTRFLMGSMGIAVGEKITRLTEYAMKRKLPLIIFAASGGARMQEGLFSLMQMAKTTAAIEKFKDAGGLFISYLTNPTTGGVSASFASLGDIIIAEPGALVLGLTEQGGGVERPHEEDAVLLNKGAVLLRHRKVGAYHPLGGDAAQADDDFRPQQTELLSQPGHTGFALGGQGVAVLGRAALDDVGDIAVGGTVEVDGKEVFVQQLAAASHEGQALLVLALAGAFAHEEHLGILHALPKHHVVPGGVQWTALAGETVGFQCFPIHKLGILSQTK